MAKHIRSIKADLCDDETLGEVSRDARYLFVGLITRVDDHGRYRANPALLRSRIYPYDTDVTNSDVASWLSELVERDRVRTYVVDGQQYLILTRWPKHQRIDNAAKSEIPPPPAESCGDSPLEGKGTEGNGDGRRVRPGQDFQPTDQHRSFAEKNGLDIQRERDHWIEHCEAKGTRYANLNMGFSTWMRNAVNFGRGKPPSNGFDPDALSRGRL